MPEDRMKNDDMNMGAGEKDKHGQQSPGHKQQDDMSKGQRAGQQNQPGHKGDFGSSEKSGAGQQGGRQGGQNR